MLKFGTFVKGVEDTNFEKSLGEFFVSLWHRYINDNDSLLLEVIIFTTLFSENVEM